MSFLVFAIRVSPIRLRGFVWSPFCKSESAGLVVPLSCDITLRFARFLDGW